MPNYRRARIPGGTYFFTLVTYQRRAFFSELHNHDLLQDVLTEVGKTYPFKMDAWVVLPDHFHCIWTLPDGDSDYSKRWGLIKAKFSQRIMNTQGRSDEKVVLKPYRREAPIWQRRFWEHLIRDEEDYRRHVEYIHYNPVKHGFVQRVREWPYSSFHGFCQRGLYSLDWGFNDALIFTGNFGE